MVGDQLEIIMKEIDKDTLYQSKLIVHKKNQSKLDLLHHACYLLEAAACW